MAWINPIYDRTLNDVNSLKNLARVIATVGWDNVTQEQRNQWLIGSAMLLSASDGYLLTSDGDNLVVGDGIIKGAINIGDLNRIQNNIRFLRDWLASDYGFSITIDDSNPTWNRQDLPFLSNINRIRDNVVALVDSTYKFPTTPTIDYNNPVNWDDANDIEKNLYDLYVILTNIPLSYVYCGTFSCGQDVIL